MSKGRRAEAAQILKKVAFTNKVNIPEKLLKVDDDGHHHDGKVWHLFTSKVLFIRTMIIFLNW